MFKWVSDVYPDYDWLPWKFEQCPQNYWSDSKNKRKFMDWASNELKLKDMSDWYQVSCEVHIKIK